MGITFIAFSEMTMKDPYAWRDDPNQPQDWLKAIKDNAEISMIDLNGTFREFFFKKGSQFRVEGNVFCFYSEDTDYLIVDHSKQHPEKKFE